MGDVSDLDLDDDDCDEINYFRGFSDERGVEEFSDTHTSVENTEVFTVDVETTQDVGLDENSGLSVPSTSSRRPSVLVEPYESVSFSTCMTHKEFQSFYFSQQELTNKSQVKWLPVEFVTPRLYVFVPDEDVNVYDLPSPREYFSKYFTSDLLTAMVYNTNLYAVQNNVQNFSATTLDEMKMFIGIHIIMGNLSYPRVCIYWEDRFRIPIISDNLAVNRFSKLRNSFHVVDCWGKVPLIDDRFWKVRPIFDSIRARCMELHLEENLSIDEQMVPFRGNLKGVKVFILCGESGRMFDFILYQGSTTEINCKFQQFGLGANIVMQLSQRITTPYCKQFFDNYFSSYWLFQWLSKHKLYMRVVL
ncbi:uncharacterized protein LOC134527733 [Bacillus rossius redtenbacheri]|uniref:uncharacterized protein LOC134527733 n=1 Tax=Bacillus rossius redtenbacheri TaxID=93214 RepID=UPI002FDD7B91